MTIKSIEPVDAEPAPEIPEEPQTTVKDMILDLGDTLVALRKKGISETNATKLIDVALGFHLASVQMRQAESAFPFPISPNQEG